jgi:secondary thiamine-phosphate synthase enzyme
MLKKLSINTKHKSELIQITDEIKEEIIKSGIKNGIAVVYTPHTTGSIFLFENIDPNLGRDLLKTLSELIPADKKYAHVGTNAGAHIKSALAGASVTLIIEDAKPILGQWQGIYFADFDGPRQRDVYIKIIS